MAIVKTKTTDQARRTYQHIFSNFFQDAVVCENKKNKAFLVKPNLAVRRGESKFDDQIVLQLVIDKFINEYNAKANLNHIETYFKINEETLEFFEEIVALLKQEIKK